MQEKNFTARPSLKSFLVVTDIVFAIAHTIPQPWLVVSPAGETSLRLAHVNKKGE